MTIKRIVRIFGGMRKPTRPWYPPEVKKRKGFTFMVENRGFIAYTVKYKGEEVFYNDNVGNYRFDDRIVTQQI